MTKSIVLMDINSHIHRAFNVATKIKSKHEEEGAYFNGKPNYIIEDSINLIENEIIKIEKENKKKADYVGLILDTEGTNFRYDIYPEYKANRPPSDREFNFMRNCIYKMLEIKGYKTLRVDNVEADDVIGALALKSEKAGLTVTIGTGDKDFFQLINENIKVYRGQEDKMYDKNEVIKKLNIEPNQVLDYLTLDGDKADNVIGIPGCGEKTCCAILKAHKLDDLIENPDLLENTDGVRGKKKIISYMKENKDFIKLMKKIVSLKTDINLGIKLRDFLKKEPDNERLNKAFAAVGVTPKYKAPQTYNTNTNTNSSAKVVNNQHRNKPLPHL